MKSNKYYTVYNDRTETETIIAAGDANECARILGMTRDSFHSFVSNTRSGRTKGFYVVVEDLNSTNDERDDDQERT